MDDLNHMLGTYRIVVVPPVRYDKPRKWHNRLLWCPWRRYDVTYVEPIPNGAISFDHKRQVMYMSAATAARLRQENSHRKAIDKGIFTA